MLRFDLRQEFGVYAGEFRSLSVPPPLGMPVSKLCVLSIEFDLASLEWADELTLAFYHQRMEGHGMWHTLDSGTLQECGGFGQCSTSGWSKF